MVILFLFCIWVVGVWIRLFLFCIICEGVMWIWVLVKVVEESVLLIISVSVFFLESSGVFIEVKFYVLLKWLCVYLIV